MALEGSEAAGERRLELRGEEDSQLCDDAPCDELVRGHVEGRVPHFDTCRKRPGMRGQSHNTIHRLL